VEEGTFTRVPIQTIGSAAWPDGPRPHAFLIRDQTVEALQWFYWLDIDWFTVYYSSKSVRDTARFMWSEDSLISMQDWDQDKLLRTNSLDFTTSF